MLYNANQEENEILKFWKDNDTFKKSLENCPEDKVYNFYDGPPFATGLPHYGHIVASLMKDVVPRFWTMKGYRVDRKWGWDCHGLPVENIIEKELNLASKKDIEEYGVGKFNEACRATVLKFANEWRTTVERMGRWVDMDLDYKTMDLPFMESVWWVFSELWKKNLIYPGYKPMQICPHCMTPLANFEVTQGYKDVKDLSVVAKFKITNPKSQAPNKLQIPITNDQNIFVLAWTTTPWTLPGNILLAVGKDIDYVIVKEIGEHTDYFVVAKERLNEVFKDHAYDVVKEVKGEELVGLEYEPLFPYYKDTPNAFRVVAAEFVSTQDGTGVVHIAPAFGEDDFGVGQKEKLPLVQHVAMDGHFKPEVTDFAGLEVKPKDDPTKTDVEIIKWLAHQGKLFKKEKFEHSYPHCWRCDTPLLNYATDSWFVRVTELKEQLLKNNESINWVPEHIKEGRFGKWLEGSRDWAISRNRFWGTPLPVWKCSNEKCDGVKVVGSVDELEQLTGKKISDLHKHLIDDLTFACEKCGGEMKRIPEVLDCWFESGSMPYAQMHYPFENKEKFEQGFPAEFIAEGQDQTRGWFYTLHVLATALTNGASPSIKKDTSVPAFKNVIVNGIVLAEDGKKMSKKLKNYPDPNVVIDKYGADADSSRRETR
jgi:isoleucyl-tRNA synthetase